jgi:tRNA(Ile2) C34 agmatinyltransferase TiaS
VTGGDGDVDPHSPTEAGTTTTSRQETCDKCGAPMDLQGSAHGFERWRCPACQQVVGVDRDPEVGSRFQISRGQPWNYSPEVFKN